MTMDRWLDMFWTRTWFQKHSSQGLTELGRPSYGGLSERYHFTLPFDINNTGQVVGESPKNQGIRCAFITGQDGKGMRDLGPRGRIL